MTGKIFACPLAGILALTLAITAVAGAAPPDTPTFTPTVTSTVSPTFTPTATISLTATISPTISPTPTLSASVTGTVPLQVVTLNHNRFNPEASETVQVIGLRPDHGQVDIQIFTQAGILVRHLVDHQSVGYTEPAWDGKNGQGETVASGVYIFVVTGTKLHKRFRIIVLK